LTKRLVISVSTKGAASAPTYSGVLVSGSQRPEDLVEAERRQITVLVADNGTGVFDNLRIRGRN
jgi:hypothetical protein